MTTYVALDRVRPNPWQPRMEIDAARNAELAADILAYLAARRETLGLLQIPAGRLVDDAGKAIQLIASAELITVGDITAWLTEAGAFVQLAYGHTRLAAFQILAQEHPEYAVLPVAIVEFSDEEMATAAWSENGQRRDLSSLEQAYAVDRYMKDFGWSQQQVAEKLRLDRSTVANKLRLLKLPAAQQDQMRRGELSERQALALLPLVELPEQVVQHAERTFSSWRKPTQVLKTAAQTSSDEIRKAVDEVVDQNTASLVNVPFVDHTFAEHPKLVSVHCTSCPARMRRGNFFRCTHLACFEEKKTLWKQVRFQAAAAQTGIQPSEKNLDYHERESFFSDEEHGRAIIKAGCERLRLVYKSDHSTAPLQPENFPDVAIVCHLERGKACACLRARRLGATRNDPARIEERERKKQVQQLVTPAETAVLEALQRNNLGVWRRLLRGVDFQSDKKSATMTLEQLHAAIAHAIVKNSLGSLAQDWPDRAKQDLEAMFKDFGIAAPWCDPLTDMRARFERIQRWMADITKVCPTIEALRGNITNLERLADDLHAITDQNDAWQQLIDRIADAHRSLEEVLPIVEQHGQLTLIAMHMVNILVTSRDEPQVESVLDELEFVPAYRYAVALLPDTPEMSNRIAQLLDRIVVLEAEQHVCAQTQAVEAS